MTLHVQCGEQTVPVTVEADGHVRVGKTSVHVTRIEPGIYRVSHEGRSSTIAVAGRADECWVFADGRVYQVEVCPGGHRAASSRRTPRHELASPMPATVVRVLVEPGDRLARGATMLFLEAMKMELPIRAPRDGVVLAVHCEPGQLVQPGVILVEFE
ncbi:MAG: acetyl-CoA carboxylase biotin carboxyl carrier protein subunit [Acidobacteriota bacterium]